MNWKILLLKGLKALRNIIWVKNDSYIYCVKLKIKWA